jgi:hypothetical protein
MTTLSVGDLEAPPGHVARGHVPVTAAGLTVPLPLALVNGSQDGPTLVVTAGIHGGEYPCVEAAARLARALDPAAVRGRMIIVPSANPVAFRARAIYVTPPDGKNLNREFPGSAGGTFTSAWARWLFENVIRGADAYIDMHGGDMIEALVPFTAWNRTGRPEVDDVARRMAEAYGIVHIVERDVQGLHGMTHAAAAHAGIPALLTEAGGQGVWDEESVRILHDGVLRVMAALGMADPLPGEVEPVVVHPGWTWLRSEHDGLFYPGVRVGDVVAEGQDLGRVADVWGETLQALVAPVGGLVLFEVTSLAMNTGDPLLAIAH